jgi:hypothetical protein
MSGDACDFSNIETRAIIKFHPPPQGKALVEIHAILTKTLRENAPSYATVKNWVAQFKLGGFSTCDAPRPGRPKTVYPETSYATAGRDPFRSAFLNRRAAARYRALASIIPGRENLSF